MLALARGDQRPSAQAGHQHAGDGPHCLNRDCVFCNHATRPPMAQLLYSNPEKDSRLWDDCGVRKLASAMTQELRYATYVDPEVNISPRFTLVSQILHQVPR